KHRRSGGSRQACQTGRTAWRPGPRYRAAKTQSKERRREVRWAMKAIATTILVVTMVFTGILTTANVVHAKGDDFNSVVKMIEQFYRVKHVGVPFLAK